MGSGVVLYAVGKTRIVCSVRDVREMGALPWSNSILTVAYKIVLLRVTESDAQ